MLPLREHIYYGVTIGFLITALATNIDLYRAAAGGVIGGTIGYIVGRLRGAREHSIKER